MSSPHANDMSFLDKPATGPETIDLNEWMSSVLQIHNSDIKSRGVFNRLKASRVGKFYVNHLKKYPLIRWLAIMLWRNGFPVYLKLNAISFYIADRTTHKLEMLQEKLTTPVEFIKPYRKPEIDLQIQAPQRTPSNPALRRHKLIALTKFSKEYNTPVIKLFGEKKIDIPQPGVFPTKDQHFLAAPHIHHPFPEIVISTINEATINGGSNLVLSKEGVIHHDLYDFRRDSTSEELHGRATINPKLNRLRWLAHDKNPVALPEAASFIDACAGNYAHWLTEVLPRITLFCAENQFKHIPIVINAGLHQNIMESLFLIVGSERKIIALDVGRAIHVNALYLTSVTGYVPFDVRNNNVKNKSHGIFSPQALLSCRNAVLDLISNPINQSSPEKIFIRRNSGTRQIVNAEALEQLLIDYGFTIIEPEKLSFQQQALVFSNARQIISSTGAALANGIFCKKGTRIGILMGKHNNMIYRYWANMLDPLRIKTSYVLGDIVKNQKLGIHGDFFIDEQHIIEMLTSWKN